MRRLKHDTSCLQAAARKLLGTVGEKLLQGLSAWDRWVGQRRDIVRNGSCTHSSTLTQYKGFPPGPFQLFKCESTVLVMRVLMTTMRRMKEAMLYWALAVSSWSVICSSWQFQGGRLYYPNLQWGAYTYKWQSSDSNPSAMDSKPLLWAIDFWGAILDPLCFCSQSSSSKLRDPLVPWGLQVSLHVVS